MKRAPLRVLFALATLALAKGARASDPFPIIIQGQLKLAEAPLCTICHLTLIGGAMTVTKPFGRNLQQKYRLVSQDFEGLKSAIMQAQANGDDVDGDGIGDIAELIQGTDPNVPEGGVAEEDVRYGCYCSASRASAPTLGGALWLSGLALSSWRRRAVRRSRVERTI